MNDLTLPDSAPELALSIQQPWAYAILHLGKDVESRTWPTNHRGRIVIHAGKKIDREGIAFIRSLGLEVPEDLPTGAFLGEVNIDRCCMVERVKSEWAFGPLCFTLSDPVAYENPVPARGHLQLFDARKAVQP